MHWHAFFSLRIPFIKMWHVDSSMKCLSIFCQRRPMTALWCKNRSVLPQKCLHILALFHLPFCLSFSQFASSRNRSFTVCTTMILSRFTSSSRPALYFLGSWFLFVDVFKTCFFWFLRQLLHSSIVLWTPRSFVLALLDAVPRTCKVTKVTNLNCTCDK